MWILIFLELLTFGIALLAMASYALEEAEVFSASSAQLNKSLGTINTLILLASGYCIAQAVAYFKQADTVASLRLLRWSMLGGVLFVFIKAIEYYAKIEAGFTIDYNSFFSFYWILTIFHLIHLLVGLVILVFVYRNIAKNKAAAKLEDIEAGAAFWHMCDLIWLLVFPVVYLMW